MLCGWSCERAPMSSSLSLKSGHTSPSHAGVADLPFIITKDPKTTRRVFTTAVFTLGVHDFDILALHFVLLSACASPPPLLLLSLLHLCPRRCQLRRRTGAAESDMNTSSCSSSWSPPHPTPPPHYTCNIQSGLPLRRRPRGKRKSSTTPDSFFLCNALNLALSELSRTPLQIKIARMA